MNHVETTAPPNRQLRDFRAVYREHYGFVWHTVHRFGVTPHLVDDALQDTFVVAFRRRGDFDGESPRAWLYGIARGVARNYRRTAQRTDRKNRAIGETLEWGKNHGSTPSEALVLLDRFLADLSEQDRELFVMSEIEGMNGPELAQILGHNQSTTYSRLRRLRQRFSTAVGTDGVTSNARSRRPRATNHAWAMLLPALDLPTRAAPATSLLATTLTAKVAWVCVGAAAATAFLVAADVFIPERGTFTQASAETSVVITDPPPQDRSTLATTRVPSAPIQERPQITDQAANPVANPVAAGNETKSTNVDRSAHARAPTKPRTATRAGLAQENALLRAASQALAHGAPAKALELASSHARRFPTSQLRDLQQALRIEALCELGRSTRARNEARTFLAQHPDSVLAPKIRSLCPTSVITPAPGGQERL